MSLNPNLGHLYHDGNISSIYTALDVQETLKTREINARETKYLDKYSQVLDRARSVCRRRNEWEQTCLRRQLKDIGLKTPSLTNSLRLESERSRKSHGMTRFHLPDINNDRNISTGNLEKKYAVEQRPILVSSWSVYSNRRSRNYSAPVTSSGHAVDEHDINKNEIVGMNKRLKVSNYFKRTDRVAKTLHKLYTQAVERKINENQMTVLDVLGKESKEELEQALFVLRGTPAGDVIEDILKEKEFVSKNVETRNIKSDKGVSGVSVDDFFISRYLPQTASCSEIFSESHTESDEISSAGNILPLVQERRNVSIAHAQRTGSQKSSVDGSLNSNSISIGSSTQLKSSSSRSTSLLRSSWTVNNESETGAVNEVFKRDDTWLMSSMLANASDIEPVPHAGRWIDLFKTPELWKQTKMKNRNTKNTKHLSLVTLTGKRRQTMLRK